MSDEYSAPQSVYDLSRKELLALPKKPAVDTTYRSILLFPATKMHRDSGWRRMVIIGVKSDFSGELIPSNPDVIRWIMPEAPERGDTIITDCIWGSSAIQFWSHSYDFRIEDYGSSINIRLVPRVYGR